MDVEGKEEDQMERTIQRRQRQDADANANCTVTEDDDSGNTIHPARGRDGTNARSDDKYKQGR